MLLVKNHKNLEKTKKQEKQTEYGNYIKSLKWSHLFHVFLDTVFALLIWIDLIYWIQPFDDIVWIFTAWSM